MNHKILISSNEITIYFLYKKDYLINQVYQYFIDDKLFKKSKEHFVTFNNLKPFTDYKIKIKINNQVYLDLLIKTKKAKEIINVLDYKVNNDGKTLVTKKIQKLLDNLKNNQILYFPKGVYLTGALFIHSNSEIYLEKGATIQGSINKDDYLPKINSRFEGIHNKSYASLINIGNLDYKKGYLTKNVIIKGEGSIFGGGINLLNSIINYEMPLLTDELKKDPKFIKVNAGRVRGRLINISNSKDIIIEGLNLGYSPSWNLHYIYSKNINIFNNTFTSYKNDNGVSMGVWNGDGIDPDSSINSYIFNNIFNTGDDCIAIKSGKNPEGNIINRPTSNCYIFNNKALEGHGMSIGSELSGGIKNIYIYDCDFIKTRYGLHIKTTPKRGGYVKNLYINNCNFNVINIRTVPYNDDGVASKDKTLFSNFYFNNIKDSNNNLFSNLTIEYDNCKNIILNNKKYR